MREAWVLFLRTICLAAGSGAAYGTAQPLWLILAIVILICQAALSEYNQYYSRQFPLYDEAVRKLRAAVARYEIPLIQRLKELDHPESLRKIQSVRASIRTACVEVELNRPMSFFHWIRGMGTGGQSIDSQVASIAESVGKLESQFFHMWSQHESVLSGLTHNDNQLIDAARRNQATFEEIRNALVQVDRTQHKQDQRIAEMDKAVVRLEVKTEKVLAKRPEADRVQVVATGAPPSVPVIEPLTPKKATNDNLPSASSEDTSASNSTGASKISAMSKPKPQVELE